MVEPMTDDALANLVEAARAATPGRPWRASHDPVFGSSVWSGDEPLMAGLSSPLAKFLARANPTAILALAARCEAAEARAERLAAALGKARTLANSATSDAEQAAEVMGAADFDLAREFVERAATAANDAWLVLDAEWHGDGA